MNTGFIFKNSRVRGGIISITRGVTSQVFTRLLNPQHLYEIWSGLTPYMLLLDTLSEYPEP